ncbi:pentatricopeptide repeat-containing protein At1g06710, mitochondrial [Phalaenopsis equestris]|uniref:pentatricopeptide repeat-containing protein At1g06710, mitochondrial n=1 Tax=Phalaenopsis equestris TaxID=78828 RepID=UPI0009E5FA58|nr:pentatricopeptide repeat-containing protein At1g06710, mitochondrial [Phalaenopsis equestris]XP_020592094.1 pentatricopeptide repeat-containing protein At1g06710, mitochondrial [Phalaenopsis equestris]XP_020592096.1 pentatricopeptide repeat-containing protein At1g06710, mitochondrial [Phalaenopsis equestris]
MSLSRRVPAAILLQCAAMPRDLSENLLCLLSMNRLISLFNTHKRGRLFFYSSRSSSCSSHIGDLQGLVDPDCSISGNGWVVCKENKKHVAVSAKDFAFLQEAAAGCNSSLKHEFSEVAVLISEAIRSNFDDLDDQTLKYLRQFRGKLDNNLVVEVLKLLKFPALAVKFFLWAGRQIGYTHNTLTYDTLLDVLGFNEKNSIPQHFFREIELDDREVLGRLLNVLIRKCCRNGFWKMAMEELGRLKDFGNRPSRTAYNALVQVLLSADMLDSAFLVHREMSDSGYYMDKFTIGCFVQALCKAGRWGEALTILEKEDFTLDTFLCTQMISGLLEASLFEEAISLLHRLRSNSHLPNIITYRTLLSGFLKKKQLGWCKRITAMMIMEGCYPSPSLFNSLLHAYCTSGDYTYAYKLLKKMDRCGCRPGYVPYNIFIGGVCGDGKASSAKMELAEKAYEEMLDVGVVLNKVNVVNFAECLCNLGKFDRIFNVLREMMSKGFVPDTSTYTKLIGCLCLSSKVEEAFSLFEEMKITGITPDVYTYTILIDTFCKVGLIQQARKWFDEMKRNGCTPNVVTYTSLIHAYLKARNVSEANQLFMSMLGMGCLPNVVTYSALIDGLCKAGDIEKACQIYSKMRGTYEGKDVDMYFQVNSTSSTEPNVFTYGALVDGLCKAHKVIEAHDLLDAMLSSGCEPNHVVYDALVDGFCKVGNLDEAQNVLVRMSQHGHNPSVYTYSSLIDRLFKDKRLDLVLEVLSKMLVNSCAPNVITYTEMIDGLCKVGKTEEAYKLFKMMVEKGSSPDVVTYTAMIDGFGNADKVDMCLEIYGQMISKGCAPNFITYTVLINHCCAAGLLDEALGILDEMKQTYWPIHVAGYGKVIEGFSGKFIASIGLLEDISNYSSMPVVPAYKIIIGSFCQAGRLDEAFELYKEVEGSSAFSPTFKLNTYSVFIEALCLASKVDKAFQLYSDMTLRGHIPELMLLFSLFKGLLCVGKWEEVLQLSYSICHMGICWVEEESSDVG